MRCSTRGVHPIGHMTRPSTMSQNVQHTPGLQFAKPAPSDGARRNALAYTAARRGAEQTRNAQCPEFL